MSKIKKIISLMLKRAFGLIKLASFVAFMLVGIPAAYNIIPLEFRPENVWDFANSVLLLHLVILITMLSQENDTSQS
jgi:hypothetical protein